jgi:hypothetical protein
MGISIKPSWISLACQCLEMIWIKLSGLRQMIQEISKMAQLAYLLPYKLAVPPRMNNGQDRNSKIDK